jgi:hypothetical protein
MAKRTIPEDRARELREVAAMLRAGVHPDEIHSPGENDISCGVWIADLLESLAEGATAAAALRLGRGRPPVADDELRATCAAYMRARVAGLGHEKAKERVADRIRDLDPRTVGNRLAECYRRGLMRALTDKEFAYLAEMPGKKDRD